MIFPQECRCGECKNDNKRRYCRAGRITGAHRCSSYEKRPKSWKKPTLKQAIRRGLRLVRTERRATATTVSSLSDGALFPASADIAIPAFISNLKKKAKNESAHVADREKKS